MAGRTLSGACSAGTTELPPRCRGGVWGTQRSRRNVIRLLWLNTLLFRLWLIPCWYFNLEMALAATRIRATAPPFQPNKNNFVAASRVPCIASPRRTKQGGIARGVPGRTHASKSGHKRDRRRWGRDLQPVGPATVWKGRGHHQHPHF